ncbi:hypothetical protein ABFS82_06G123000 [Erythranthe guttata]|uniref:Proliferating cell nuclear antigen PCNA N-terminal domain-containing protein n=1 Tax=Erythranthe guttata TaxID=4155 RepID=A0A022R8I7_ERYGU|nr:PREDICTED: proliferating cell nuclear antigen-like [Erythranthe guttata]EYU35200.1 hypothetical protein MIMGU_mgv1a023224mg [Erythranthe guttata]|eukprot:XP_012839947.1 PREDICTED: proliferating cell nuclear antigen-like [Erythranthe guttata]
MLELRLARGSLLKKVVEAIKDFVDDANFDFSATGLYVQTMDSYEAAMVELLLRRDGFVHYRCDRKISIGVNFENMSEMLEGAGEDDVITLKADDGSSDLTFVFENPAQDIITEFKMKILDTEYDATVRMSSLRFAKVCKNLFCIGKKVVISVTNEGVRFSTSGDSGSTTTIFCRQNTTADKPEDATVIEVKREMSLLFLLSFLCKITEATPLSNTVTLSFCTEFPLRVEYKIAEMGYIRFHLSPKI